VRHYGLRPGETTNCKVPQITNDRLLNGWTVGSQIVIVLLLILFISFCNAYFSIRPTFLASDAQNTETDSSTGTFLSVFSEIHEEANQLPCKSQYFWPPTYIAHKRSCLAHHTATKQLIKCRSNTNSSSWFFRRVFRRVFKMHKYIDIVAIIQTRLSSWSSRIIIMHLL